MILVPDEHNQRLLQRIEPISRRALPWLSPMVSISYHQIVPRADLDVIMIAQKARHSLLPRPQVRPSLIPFIRCSKKPSRLPFYCTANAGTKVVTKPISYQPNQ